MGLLLLTLLVTVARAQVREWCSVDPLSRVTCLFHERAACESFGCCWDDASNASSSLACYDPGNGCHGPPITVSTIDELFKTDPSSSSEAHLGQASFVAQVRLCGYAPNTWESCDAWAPGIEHIILGSDPSTPPCVSYNCPAFSPLLQGSVQSGFNVSLTSGQVTSGFGMLDLKTGLIAPFKLDIKDETSKLPGMVIEIGYMSKNCIRLQSQIQNLTTSRGLNYQASFSLRSTFF